MPRAARNRNCCFPLTEIAGQAGKTAPNKQNYSEPNFRLQLTANRWVGAKPLVLDGFHFSVDCKLAMERALQRHEHDFRLTAIVQLV